MKGIPADVGDAIDKSLCAYDGYFPNIRCILRTCQNYGTAKYKQQILDANASKITDKTRRFMIKQWITKTVNKAGVIQSYIDWKFERCIYIELVDLLMQSMEVMAEHTFMASWNYCQ